MAPSGKGRAEVVTSKSPAEFFAENQNIAGFDNPGKSLYTTIRELVENSLDATETIGVLPDIKVTVEELNEAELDVLRGIKTRERVDHGLFKKKAAKGSRKEQEAKTATVETDGANGQGEQKSEAPQQEQGKKKRDRMFYRVVVEDNGCGMAHDRIPDMLGRVLSGSKYGVRQTRGKFGLGSKMALIWSKKSTGMPIEIESAHSTDVGRPPAQRSHVVLDIDIYRNEPQLRLYEKAPNPEGWRGSLITVIVEGNWTTYKSHTMHYFQQLAIITPYAQMEVTFRCLSNAARESKTVYARRSDRMPAPTREVKHHPSSVNHLIVQQLLEHTKAKTLVQFLSSELAAVDKSLALRIIKEVGGDFWEGMPPSEVDHLKAVRLSNLLKSVSIFKPPDGDCLSPAGEYNLRLGIMKEMHPDYVATVKEAPAVFEGHPFIVEAGVSLGGSAVKDGINVYRFANRIPLLFEAGNDVVTQVANKRIRWSNFKIDPKKDRIGVFVSIVSTKIPFKGTGKEYIGDDIEEMRKSVKNAIMHCCKQLKQHLISRNAARESKERKKSLLRYAPDVSRALAAVVDGMRKRKRASEKEDGEEGASGSQASQKAKMQVLRLVEGEWEACNSTSLKALMGEIAGETDLEKRLKTSLELSIEKLDLESALEATDGTGKGAAQKQEALILAPLRLDALLTHQMVHPACGVRFLSAALSQWAWGGR